ncbi:MAG: Crp/Fnr family transcriptional regulator [Rhodospirillaceae bacterium]
MPSRFVRKLETFEKLSKADRQAFLDVCQNIRKIGARKVMIEQGDWSYLFLSGLACRYQMLEDGTRQITDFLVPGDLYNGYAVLPDASISSLSQCNVAYVTRDRFAQIMERHPRLARAMWRLALAEAAVLREWTANIGGRPADKRVAHLLCELCLRLGEGEPRHDNSYVLPLSQVDLADATALSPVHINRVLGRLRDRRLVGLQRRSITVKDVKRLMAFAQFNGAYLQALHGNTQD